MSNHTITPNAIHWTTPDGDEVRVSHEDTTGLGGEGLGLVSTISGYGEIVTADQIQASPDYPADVKAWARGIA